MSIWTLISDALPALVAKGESLLAFFERRRAARARAWPSPSPSSASAPRWPRPTASCAPAEVSAFRGVFQIAPADEAAAARVFNLARQDTAGFDGLCDPDRPHVPRRTPAARGHPRGPLRHRAGRRPLPRGRGGLPQPGGPKYSASPPPPSTASRPATSPGAPATPGKYSACHATPSFATVRARWRELVRTHHPDKMIARGLPLETVNLANASLATINPAWEEISARLRAPGKATGTA